MKNEGLSEAATTLLAGLDQMKRQMSNPVLMMLLEAEEAGRIVQLLGDRLGNDVELVSLRMRDGVKQEFPDSGNAERITLDDCFSLLPSAHQVEVDGRRIVLKKKEYSLLHHLATHAGTVFQRDMLYNLIWGPDTSGSASTVTVHINRIRKQIEADPSNPRYIHTVWGGGYCFKISSPLYK